MGGPIIWVAQLYGWSNYMGGPIAAFSACLTALTLCLPSCVKACRTDSLIKHKKHEEMIKIVTTKYSCFTVIKVTCL